MSGVSPDFASYPRARLTLLWGRRQLLTALPTELRVRGERAKGVSDLKIPDLGLFPDDLIELLTPVLLSEYVADGEQEFQMTVALIDGRLTIKEIADRLRAETGWDDGYGLRYVRGVFLYLVSLGHCLPKR